MMELNRHKPIDTRDPHDVASRILGSWLDTSDALRRLILANAQLIEQIGSAIPLAIEAWRTRPVACQATDRQPVDQGRALPVAAKDPNFCCVSRKMDAMAESPMAADPSGGALTEGDKAAAPIEPIALGCSYHGVPPGAPCPGEVPADWQPEVNIDALLSSFQKNGETADLPAEQKGEDAAPTPIVQMARVTTASGRRIATGDAVVTGTGWYRIIEATDDGVRVKPGFILGGVSPPIASDWLTNEELLAAHVVAPGDWFESEGAPNCPGRKVFVSSIDPENGFAQLSQMFTAGYRADDPSKMETFDSVIANASVCALVAGNTQWYRVDEQVRGILPVEEHASVPSAEESPGSPAEETVP